MSYIDLSAIFNKYKSTAPKINSETFDSFEAAFDIYQNCI